MMNVQFENGKVSHVIVEIAPKPLQFGVLAVVQKAVARFALDVQAIPPPGKAQLHSKQSAQPDLADNNNVRPSKIATHVVNRRFSIPSPPIRRSFYQSRQLKTIFMRTQVQERAGSDIVVGTPPTATAGTLQPLDLVGNTVGVQEVARESASSDD